MDAIVRTITLDPVRLYSQTLIDANLLNHISEAERMQVLADEDRLARRHILKCFGKSGTIELSCPATWWDHLKARLKERWPRLFRRLRVNWRHEALETGAVVAGLEPLKARHMVIPYVMGEPSWPSNPAS